MRIWQAIEASPAAMQALGKGKIGTRRQTILKAYLVTEASQEDLKPLSGLKTIPGIRKQLYRSMEIVFPHLSDEVRQEYQTPKQPLQARSGTYTETHRRRLRQALDKEHRPDLERIEFSATHKTHLSEAASRRWQRAREANKAAQTEDQK